MSITQINSSRGTHTCDNADCCKAAEQGDATAQFNLGRSYYIGDGFNKSVVEAVKWCGKAAEQGNADAQYFLGACYVLGEGVAENDAEAVKWFRKSAEQGNALAKSLLDAMLGKK